MNLHHHTLLAWFPILGCNYLSLSLEQRKWQKCYRSCPGDGNVHHHCPRNANTRVWGLHLACNHVVQHDGFHSSCCLSKSKNKNKSAKETWNKINSFFGTNCRCLTKRTGHYSWPCCSFSWSDCACNHPSFCRTCCSSCPCCCINHNHGIDRLDEDNQVSGRCDRIGRFDVSCNICGNGAACSSIHGYER